MKLRRKMFIIIFTSFLLLACLTPTSSLYNTSTIDNTYITAQKSDAMVLHSARVANPVQLLIFTTFIILLFCIKTINNLPPAISPHCLEATIFKLKVREFLLPLKFTSAYVDLSIIHSDR